ncbi:MAG: glycerol-3-phosphate acyltransferase [Sulfurovum sp.]|nr:glycerol-3-phosphate acyltransferase [Sulfurovum sp.]
MGHCFSVLSFEGGKGVATGFGVCLSRDAIHCTHCHWGMARSCEGLKISSLSSLSHWTFSIYYSFVSALSPSRRYWFSCTHLDCFYH